MSDDVSAGRRARALFSYRPQYDTDLAVRKGDVYEVVATIVPGQWWQVRLADGSTAAGTAPMAYFELLKESERVVLDRLPPPVPFDTRPSTFTNGPTSTARRATVPARPPSSVATVEGARAPAPPSVRGQNTADDVEVRGPAAQVAPPRRPPPSLPGRARTPGEAPAVLPFKDSSASQNPVCAEREPLFMSLEDRLEALKGRGLAASRPPPHAAAAPPPVPAPTPASRPVCEVPSSDSSTSVTSDAPADLSEVDNLSLADPQAVSRAPPRLPPRLPSRSASSPEASLARSPGAIPSHKDLSLAVSSIALGAQRKPPPIPTRQPLLSATSVQGPVSSRVHLPAPPPRRPGLTTTLALPKSPPRPETPPPLTFTLIVPSPQARPLSDPALGLASEWFCRQPLTFPDALLRLPHTSLAAGGQFSAGGGPSRLDVGILYGDRSRGFVTIEWGAGLTTRAPRVTQRQTGLPRPRTVEELASAAEVFGERVARWAEAHEGTVVGRGECWDLADHALKEVSRELVDESGGEFEGLAEAVGVSFGEVVFVNVEGAVAWGPEHRIRRGDILQFVHATFKSYFSDGSSSTSTAGDPTTGHTAVVVADWSGAGAQPVRVLQANVGGSPLTRPGEFSLGDLVSGEVRAFRPMSNAWSGGPARPHP